MIDFYKYHALGNDYIIIDPNKPGLLPELNKNNIQLICNRNYGIGSDGILYGPIIKDDQISLLIFNPDGSEAEKSGNGVRIFALYIFDKQYVKSQNFDLYTKGGKIKIEIKSLKSNLVTALMGQYSFLSKDIPVIINDKEALNQEIQLINGYKEKIHCVSIGNPHCVMIKSEVSKDLILNYGPILERHKIFPNKINVQVVQVLDRSNIKIEIWERGAGYTLASGTSACAATSVSYKLNLVNSSVTVHMRGGKVMTRIVGKEIFLAGEVSRVLNGSFNKEFIRKLT